MDKLTTQPQQPEPEPKSVKRHWVLGYGLAIVLYGATIGLSILLSNLDVTINLTIPIVLALVCTAWYGGRGPGLLISVLFQATTIIYTPIPPDSGITQAVFAYFSVFSLYVFLVLVISGLRRIQQTMAAQRDLLRVTLSSIGDAVIATDTKGAVTFMNPVAQQLTGWDESEARGRRLGDVVQIVHEETREKVINPVVRAFQTGSPVGLENHSVLISKCGKEIPIDNSAAPIRDGGEIKGVVMVFSDVTRRKQAEAVSATLASIVESSSDAIVSKDLNGIITSWNKGAEEIFGYTAAEAVGRSVTILMPEERVNEEPGILERIRRGEDIDHYETVRRHKNGRLIDISLNVSPVYDPEGRIIGASKIARDITEQKRAARAIRESETMHRIVEAQESERHRIARDLHDHLGQKMTALRMQIEGLIEKAGDDSALGRSIDDVQEAASHIDRDIGFLSWELRPTELENLGLVDALGSFVREWSRQYGIAAEFHTTKIESGKGARLTQNVETNLYRIVQEALNNVLKHADAESVSVLLQQRKDQLVLIIEDNGRGFAREFNGSDGKKPSGLGLIGMQERAALLKGDLEIDSGGNGTTVMARIPLH